MPGRDLCLGCPWWCEFEAYCKGDWKTAKEELEDAKAKQESEQRNPTEG